MKQLYWLGEGLLVWGRVWVSEDRTKVSKVKMKCEDWHGTCEDLVLKSEDFEPGLRWVDLQFMTPNIITAK